MHMYNDGCEYKMFCPGIIPNFQLPPFACSTLQIKEERYF